VESFAAGLQMLRIDAHAAIHFGQTRAESVRSGCPFGPYDLMMAGHARSRALVLVSNNVRELQRVPGPRSENWVSAPVLVEPDPVPARG
jgi:tRNA(fMet)-specific endonuclease VapC